MGKVIKTVVKIGAIVAGVALAIPTMGGSLLAVTLGVSALAAAGIAGGLGLISALLSGGPKIPQSKTHIGRLSATLDSRAPRKMVLGTTAMPPDIRYYEGSGTDEEYVDYIIAVAAHRVGSIDEIWFEDQLAWTSVGGVQGEYVGYLTTVTTRLEGTSANTIAINGGTRWGSDDRLTGCAYIHMRIKRTGNTEDAQSPLVSGLPGRMTIIGEGMPMYDPRLDSTVGGVGTHRAGDQTTWGPSIENPVIQALNVLLGWRINSKLSVGAGLPVKYINLDSVITAANICDESIALSGGGTQARYRTAGAFSTDDAPMRIVAALLSGCAGDLFDSDGQLSFFIKTNTLATPAVEFDDRDVLSAASWAPMGGQTNLPNIISGSFTDPSNNSLYQMVPYPSVSLPSEDGIERTANVDFAVVENAARAERLAKQTLQRMQYPGTFTAEYNMKAMAAKIGTIVHQTYSPLGWVDKPFRVVSQKPSRTGRIMLLLREENVAIYAWASEDSASVQPAAPVGFNVLNTGPILLARKAAQIGREALVLATERGKVFFSPTMPTTDESNVGDTWVDADGVFYDRVGTSIVLGGFVVTLDGFRPSLPWARSVVQPLEEVITTANGKATTFYEYEEPIPDAIGDLWIDVDASPITMFRWNGSAWQKASTLGADWSTVVGSGKPADNADVTLDQAVVSKLDPFTGNAGSGFLSEHNYNFSQIVGSGSARDGDNVSFASTLPRVPQMVFLPGGNAANAGQNIRIQANSLTTTGFIMVAKAQSVTAGATITDSPSTAGGVGDPNRVINRTDGGTPFDGVFEYQFTATIGLVGPYGIPDTLSAYLYAKIGGAWIEVGSSAVGASGTYKIDVAPGTVDFGTGNEFGISFTNEYGSSTGAFDQVSYTLGTVTETSLTPSGASSIRWLALLD